MASLILNWLDAGDTPFVKLFNAGTQQGGNIALTDIDGTGNYQGNLPGGTPAALYDVVFYDGLGRKVGAAQLDWDGTAEVPSSLEQRVIELHQLEGLDSLNPLVIDQGTARSAGAIQQSIANVGNTTTVTRL